MMQQVQHWAPLPWGQPRSMHSSLEAAHPPDGGMYAQQGKPQKLVLQPQPTGLGMQINYVNPAQQQAPSMQPHLGGLPAAHAGFPWAAAGARPAAAGLQHGAGSSTFSTL